MEKICPFSMVRENPIGRACKGKHCMAWDEVDLRCKLIPEPKESKRFQTVIEQLMIAIRALAGRL